MRHFQSDDATLCFVLKQDLRNSAKYVRTYGLTLFCGKRPACTKTGLQAIVFHVTTGIFLVMSKMQKMRIYLLAWGRSETNGGPAMSLAPQNRVSGREGNDRNPQSWPDSSMYRSDQCSRLVFSRCFWALSTGKRVHRSEFLRGPATL